MPAPGCGDPAAGAPFAVYAGDPGSPVILHVPHGSRELTALARSGLLLDGPALERELDRMTDAHTGALAARAARDAARRPWIFENRYSRLVVDPERFPDGREEMAAVGMAAVYARTSDGAPLRTSDPARDEELLARYYRPYAAGVAALVDERLAATGRAVILDIHSYPARPLPYELHASGARPAVCLGTDPFHTPPGLLAAGRRAFADLGDVDLDTPFAGCYVPLRHWRAEPAVIALMIEIRRDTYVTAPGGPPTSGLDGLAAALAGLVDAADRVVPHR